jgi:hypothetical protein
MRTPISTEASTSFRVRMEESSECRGNRTRRSVIFKVNDEAPIINRTYSAIRRPSTDVASEYRPRFTLRVLDFGSRLMEEPINNTAGKMRSSSVVAIVYCANLITTLSRKASRHKRLLLPSKFGPTDGRSESVGCH